VICCLSGGDAPQVTRTLGPEDLLALRFGISALFCRTRLARFGAPGGAWAEDRAALCQARSRTRHRRSEWAPASRLRPGQDFIPPAADRRAVLGIVSARSAWADADAPGVAALIPAAAH
jgi:hypothetical protein